MPPHRDATIKLSDGRRLAYAEWGDLDGSPIIFFHGTPHSRLWCPDELATASEEIRLITVDRPGIGRSDIKQARTFSDWPDDVVSLANALGVPRFAVIGWSGGGPYAAACAALIPTRLTGVGIVSSRHLAQYNFGERPMLTGSSVSRKGKSSTWHSATRWLQPSCPESEVRISSRGCRSAPKVSLTLRKPPRETAGSLRILPV